MNQKKLNEKNQKLKARIEIFFEWSMVSTSVFIFNLVVSKFSIVKFSKFFEIYFLKLTLKEPILPKKNLV
jgi:hypothetical protein